MARCSARYVDRAESTPKRRPGHCSYKPRSQPVYGRVYEGQSETGGALIREIGSDRLCDYANEWFYRIEKSILGPEILDGERYALYKKVENAAQDINGDTYYVTAFELDDYSCKISLRKCWRKNEIRNIRLPIEKTSSIEDIRAGLSAAIEKETTNES